MSQKSNKILVVCQHFWPETFRINDICDFFIEKKCDIDVLTGIPNYPKGRFFEGYSYFKNRHQIYNGMQIRRVFEIPRGNNTNFRIFLNYVSFPTASLLHIPRLLFNKYDRIFLYQLSPVMMSIAGIVIGKLRNTETVMYVLDLWPENLYSVLPIKSRILRSVASKVSNWHYKHVDKLIVLSEKMKQRLIESTAIEEGKIIILPQTCEKVYEEEIFDAKLAARFKGKFNVLFTGNISPAQSFETVVAAAKRIRDDGIRDINWIIVGDGMSLQWLKAEVKKAQLSDYFIFEGFKPIADIPRYTNFADVLLGCLVKSDLLEATIPAKVFSYFAAGRPIVLAMDGEAQALVNTVKCGYAGPAEDADQLAENIKRVYAATKAERALMGRKAKQYHFKNFERDLILNKLYSFMFS